jgi:hypothetical protein
MGALSILAALSAVFTVGGTLFSQLWWLYKRGQAAGAEKASRDTARAEDKAKVEDLERQLTETRADLADTRSKLSTYRDAAGGPDRAEDATA